MSDRISDNDISKWERLEKFGLHKRPLHSPLGDVHHCDVDLIPEDVELGELLAWFMGTLSNGRPRHPQCYCHNSLTSVEEWSRVVRAIRIHGMKLSNRRIYRVREEDRYITDVLQATIDNIERLKSACELIISLGGIPVISRKEGFEGGSGEGQEK